MEGAGAGHINIEKLAIVCRVSSSERYTQDVL